MKNNTECVICRSEMEYLMSGRDFFYRTTDKSYDIFKCASCNIMQIYPLPDSNEIEEFYPKEYYSFNADQDSFSKIKDILADFYYRKTKLFWVRKTLAIIFNRFFYLGLLHEKTGSSSFLDVGCGSGHDVRLMRKYGWKAFGFEVGPVSDCDGIFFHQSLEQVDFSRNKFQYIRIWQVLEHVPNPRTFLDKVGEIILPGGEIIIGIPNTDSLWAKLFGRYWFGIDAPRHLFNFNERNLKLILENNNFRIKKIRYQSLNGLVGSLQHFINDKLKTNFKIFNNMFIVIIFYPIELICNLLHVSDAVAIVAEKNQI